MAKADSIFELARAAVGGDRERVISLTRIIAANEPASSKLKTRLERLLNNVTKQTPVLEMLPKDLAGLVNAEQPRANLANAVLPVEINYELEAVLDEQTFADEIHNAGLPTPNRILLSGPPGNGKTTLAGAIADALDRPFFTADFSRIISSHMGETGSKIAKLFRGVSERPCVLFVDEMETLLSERAGYAGTNEVGEAKRIVSTLLLEIDRLPDHVMLVGATNHEEMLDRAVVRRFDYHWNLPAPTPEVVDRWRHQFAKRHPSLPVLGEMPDSILDGSSISDIEREAKKWCRRWVVSTARQARTA